MQNSRARARGKGAAKSCGFAFKSLIVQRDEAILSYVATRVELEGLKVENVAFWLALKV